MRHFLIKVLALGSFVGGPLWLADTLKPRLGQDVAFAITFAPLAVLILASLSIAGDRPTPVTRLLAFAGVGGAAALLVMDAMAAHFLLRGGSHSEPTLIWIGNAIGAVTALLYFGAALAFVRTNDEPSPD